MGRLDAIGLVLVLVLVVYLLVVSRHQLQLFLLQLMDLQPPHLLASFALPSILLTSVFFSASFLLLLLFQPVSPAESASPGQLEASQEVGARTFCPPARGSSGPPPGSLLALQDSPPLFQVPVVSWTLLSWPASCFKVPKDQVMRSGDEIR